MAVTYPFNLPFSTTQIIITAKGGTPSSFRPLSTVTIYSETFMQGSWEVCMMHVCLLTPVCTAKQSMEVYCRERNGNFKD